MRGLASALRSTAGQIDSIDSSVYGRVSGMAFTGPAAVRLDHTIRGWHVDLSGVVQELRDTAGLLERAASTVEEEQLARDRLQRQLEAEGRPQ